MVIVDSGVVSVHVLLGKMISIVVTAEVSALDFVMIATFVMVIAIAFMVVVVAFIAVDIFVVVLLLS